MASRWAPYDFQEIKRAYPEFKSLGVKPSLDSIVVEFLERYEVYVTPAGTSNRRTGGEVASDAFFGAMSGATGNHEYAADAAIIRNQKSGAAVQEWTQWKQWALDHKDFETLRAERFDDWEKLNTRIESDKFAEEWSTKRDAIKKEEEELGGKEQKTFAKVAIIVIVAFIGLYIIVPELDKKKKSNPNTGKILQHIELASQLT